MKTKVHWNRVAVALLSLLLLGMVIGNGVPLLGWPIALHQSDFRAGSSQDGLMSLCVLALNVLLIVAVVKILSRSAGSGD